MRDTGSESSDGRQAVNARRVVRGWVGTVLPAGMLVYVIVTAAGVQQHAEGAGLAAGYAIAAAFCCAYLLLVVASRRDWWPVYWSMLAVMTGLFIAEVPFAGGDAFYLCAVIVPLVVLRHRSLTAPLVTLAVVAGVVVPWSENSWHGRPGWIEAFDILFTSLLMLGANEIINTNQALVEARAEVERLASEAERSRIARDLHDLLGHSLTAITVKAGLARRLTENDPARAAHEIAEVESLTRQTLADVRAAVSGYRDVTLLGELARGRELLRASGVAADLPTATDMVDATHQELFGWVVREGLTNVARHARATRCTVTLSASAVEIRDDGVGGPDAGPGATLPAGNGLVGLRERVAAAGGSVEAGPLSPRGWRLRVSLAPTAAAAI